MGILGGPLDKGLALLGMGGIVLVQIGLLLKGIFDSHTFNGFMMVKVANDCCGIVIAVLLFCFWHSMCFRDPRMRKLLKRKIPPLAPQGVLPGGFLPIPAAASVSLLLWITGSFVVEESNVPGSFLPMASMWIIPDKTCRANAVEDKDYYTTWFSRLVRGAPVANFLSRDVMVEQGGRKMPHGTCYTGQADQNALMPLDFGKDKVLHAVTDAPYNETCTWKETQFVTCYFRDCAATKYNGNTPNTPDCVSNLANPAGEDGRVCLYQCVHWAVWSLRSLLESIGALAAGAGIVVWLTGVASAKVGAPFITDQTSAAEMTKLIEKTNPDNCIPRAMSHISNSYCFAAFPIVVVYFVLKVFLVTRVDSDGFYTVDYYVTFAMLFATFMVMLMRCWHPWAGARQLFTANVWAYGVDQFVVTEDVLKEIKEDGDGFFDTADVVQDLGGGLKLMNVDLYQWIHLKRQHRLELLMNYARRPDPEGCAEGIDIMSLTDLNAKCEAIESGRYIYKAIKIKRGDHVKIVRWKDDATAVATTGSGDEVEVTALMFVETSVEWTETRTKAKTHSIQEGTAGNVAKGRTSLVSPLIGNELPL